MPTESIEQLVSLVSQDCVRSVVAKDQFEVDRWTSDYAVFLKEGKEVLLLDKSHARLVEDAAAEWSAMFARFLRPFGNSETNFVIWFLALREKAIKTGVLPLRAAGEDEYGFLTHAPEIARRLVNHIGWPTTFAAYLPRAHPEAALLAAAIGAQMSAVMWLEQLAKARDASDRGRGYPKDIAFDVENIGFAKLNALLDTCRERLSE